MAGCMKESTLMIRKKGLESLYGLVGRSMWGSGRMGNSMERDIFWIRVGRKWKENGVMAKELKYCKSKHLYLLL